ncbi:odorant receptor 67c-like isoform X3 [Cylas formicarius]|nr:odorant receptor 67c-like isoform X3 [Cylas formicarius]
MAPNAELFRNARWLMIASGTWRLDIPNVPKSFYKFYKIYSTAIHLYYSSTPVALLLELYSLFKYDKVAGFENISMFIYMVILIVKIRICQSRRVIELLRTSLKEETDIHSQSDKNILKIYKSHVSYCTKITTFLTVLVVWSAIYLSGSGIINSWTFPEFVSNETVSKPLPLSLWYPFDKNKHHNFVLSHQITQIMLTSLFSGSVHTFSNSVMIYLRARLVILQHQFKNFDSITACTESPKVDLAGHLRLKALSIKHQRLIRSVHNLNQLLQGIMVLEYSVTSVVLAAVIFQILEREELIFNCSYFVLVTCQLMALAWNSDQIIVQSFGLSTSLYSSRWYEQDLTTKRMTHIMIMRCQKPLCLTIGSFGAMTTDAALS